MGASSISPPSSPSVQWGAGFAAYAATKGAVEAFTAELPLGRFGGVEDVAYCAVVLAADEAGYLTGQTLHPSVGWVMG
jgi:NAD(P)-dependent dehydrogenase (short-subunit alcohol dehydrogenase family)